MTDTKRLGWWVKRRADNQALLLDLLTFAEADRPLPTPQATQLQLLIGAGFSLWRAAFLGDGELPELTTRERANAFLRVIVEDNAVPFSKDQANKEWTFGYYLNNAYFRLQLAYRRLPEIGLAGTPQLRATVDEFLERQTEAGHHDLDLQTAWLNAHKAARDVFEAMTKATDDRPQMGGA